MFQNELDNRSRIIQAVGMMADLRLVQDFDNPTQLAIAGFDPLRVFTPRHHVIGIANYVNQRDSRLLKWLELINWISSVSLCRCLILKFIKLQKLPPVSGTSFADTQSTGPTLEVKYGSITVDHRNPLGMRDGVIVGIQSATTDADEHSFLRQPAATQFIVETAEPPDRLRRAKRVSDIAIDMIATGGQ